MIAAVMELVQTIAAQAHDLADLEDGIRALHADVLAFIEREPCGHLYSIEERLGVLLARVTRQVNPAQVEWNQPRTITASKYSSEEAAQLREIYGADWEHGPPVSGYAFDLVAAIRRLLAFQYEHIGYGSFRCRSCGAYAVMGETGSAEHREPCSPSCPWEVARSLLPPE